MCTILDKLPHCCCWYLQIWFFGDNCDSYQQGHANIWCTAAQVNEYIYISKAMRMHSWTLICWLILGMIVSPFVFNLSISIWNNHYINMPTHLIYKIMPTHLIYKILKGITLYNFGDVSFLVCGSLTVYICNVLKPNYWNIKCLCIYVSM